MKGAFAFITLGVFALANLVGATPIAAPGAAEVSVAKRDLVDIDIIVTDLFNDVVVINKDYETKCKDSCTTNHVKSWCKEIADKCYVAIDKCKQLPSGHKFVKVDIIAAIVVKLLVAINVTLKFLLAKCGLLATLLIGVANLVLVLIAALNALLACLVIYCDGLLALVISLLGDVLDLVACLLCTLGLILI